MIVRYIQYITFVIACRRIDYEEHILTLSYDSLWFYEFHQRVLCTVETTPY